jgi:AraC-like DNA-binding protein
MPYPFLTVLPVWIASCTRERVEKPVQLENGEDDNLILQIISGRMTVVCNGEQRELLTRSILFLGRKTCAEIIPVGNKACRYIALVYRNVQTPPFLDLNRLCLNAPLVDSFFAQKTRFCTLEDKCFVNVTLGEIRYEWENRLSEMDTAVRAAMENLFIKLSRSFHADNRLGSVRYLNDAKKYMHKHFQQDLTVESIALGVGISRSYLEALFNRYIRGSIVDYLHSVRCDHAAQLLANTRFPIIDIALDSGFHNRQHFARVFQEVYGYTPSAYRKRTHLAAGKTR